LNYNTNLAVSQEPPQNYWLYFRCRGDGEELVTSGLPTPHFYKRHTSDGYSIAYKLDGYFYTRKNKEYLNDMIARICLTLPIERRYNIIPNESEAVNNPAYKLKEFQNCESIKVDIYTRKEAKANKYEDRVFWSLKYEAERRIRAFGSLDLEMFIDYAFNVFDVKVDVKDGSTLRAKCRSIFEWYESRDFRLPKTSRKKENAMSNDEKTQVARAVKVARAKAQFNCAIDVLNIRGVKLTAKAISEESGVSINTCGKYFKAYKESQK